MPTDLKTVRVFIYSTFRDMHAERDHLVTVAFPELRPPSSRKAALWRGRRSVEQLGLEFFDVDARGKAEG